MSRPGPRFNIKITSYQFRKSHCGDKTILRLFYLHNGNSYTGKMKSLYWIRALALCVLRHQELCHWLCWVHDSFVSQKKEYVKVWTNRNSDMIFFYLYSRYSVKILKTMIRFFLWDMEIFQSDFPYGTIRRPISSMILPSWFRFVKWALGHEPYQLK